MMPYGREWKNGRKLLWEFMNPRAIVKFDGYQRKYTHRLLSCLAETPKHFLNHVKLYVPLLSLLIHRLLSFKAQLLPSLWR